MRTILVLLAVAGLVSAEDSPLVALAKRTNRKLSTKAVITNATVAASRGRLSGSTGETAAPAQTPAVPAAYGMPAPPPPDPTASAAAVAKPQTRAVAPSPGYPSSTVRNIEPSSSARTIDPLSTARTIVPYSGAGTIDPQDTSRTIQPQSTAQNIPPQASAPPQ